MKVLDYLIIAAVIVCLIEAVIHIVRVKKRGGTVGCGSSCSGCETCQEDKRKCTGDGNDENSGGCGKLS
jgi:hypothetical protein